LRVRLAKPACRLDSLIGAVRGHADVGDDNVRMLRVDGREQRVEVAACGDHLDLGVCLEQASHALANEVVILREHETDRHTNRIGRRGSCLYLGSRMMTEWRTSSS